MSYNKDYIEFHNGHRMPIVGLGTWQGSDAEMKTAIRAAVNAGYRHIDTAYIYLNEKGIGSALKEIFAEGKIKREDLFIVTKLPAIGLRPQHVKHFLKKSLENLQLDYVDLYLVHNPIGWKYINDNNVFPLGADGTISIDPETDLVATWKAMEDMVNLGLTKSIGISNFVQSQIQRILDICRIKPANLQVEIHAYLHQNELVDFCHKNGITVCAYSPIGSPGLPAFLEKFGPRFGGGMERPSLLKDSQVSSLAYKYKKTVPQILLRFLMQRQLAVIPKSTNPERIKQNFDVFDFKLSPDDMKIMAGLDKNFRMLPLTSLPGMEKHPEAVAMMKAGM